MAIDGRQQYAFVVAAALDAAAKRNDQNAYEVERTLHEELGFQVKKLNCAGSRVEVDAARRTFLKLPKAEDLLLIYVNCHAAPRGGQFVADLAFDFGTGDLTLLNLFDLLNQSPTRQIILVVDACHSGCIPRLAPPKLQDAITVLYSCAANELSCELDHPPLGLFTHLFLEALRRLKTGRESITAGEVHAEIQRQIQAAEFQRVIQAKNQSPQATQTPGLHPPGHAGRTLAWVQPSTPDEPALGTLRNFGERMLDVIFNARTRRGADPGRPDAQTAWLIYLNSVANPGTLPGGCWADSDRGLLEAILDAEAGPKASADPAVEPGQRRGSWVPFCRFLFFYASQWEAWSGRLSAEAQQVAQHAAREIMQEIENLARRHGALGVRTREIDEWRELAERLKHQKLGLHVAFDVEHGPNADTLAARVLLCLACQTKAIE